MNQNQIKKQVYATPICEIHHSEIENLLVSSSGNAGTIGGGSGGGDAKRWDGFWDEEDECTENARYQSFTPWDD